MPLDLSTIKLFYDHRDTFSELPPKVINDLCKYKLLKYLSSGELIVTRKGRSLRTSILKASREMRAGLPLYERVTFGSIAEHSFELWSRGQISSTKYLTNGEIILLTPTFRGLTFKEDVNLMMIDLLIGAIIEKIRFSDYVVIEPVCFQRENYFSSGLVWFSSGTQLIPVQESYYDLVVTHWPIIKTQCRFALVFAPQSYVVVLNTYSGLNCPCDVISIISPCIVEDHSEVPTSFLKIPDLFL